jgi:nicotinate-nucleotide pyrophosphorylase (carboxylating)
LRRNVKITNQILLEERIREFLREDIGFGDITSESLIDAGLEGVALIICREDAVVAGLEETSILFSLLGCRAKQLVPDGEVVKKDSVLMEIRGHVRSILLGERTALNLLMRMSGIATATRTAVEKAESKNPEIRVAATRKTVPGLRLFDKKAVALGGGDTHRLRLDDCVLVKNNHISIVGSVSEAVSKAREKVSFSKKVEVEVDSMKQAIDAAEAGADIVMLDNFSPDRILKTIERLEEMGLRKDLLIESSGGITLENIEEYAAAGVDIISLGSLTHSVRAINMNLRIKE